MYILQLNVTNLVRVMPKMKLKWKLCQLLNPLTTCPFDQCHNHQGGALIISSKDPHQTYTPKLYERTQAPLMHLLPLYERTQAQESTQDNGGPKPMMPLPQTFCILKQVVDFIGIL